jgi:uncharacterized protein YqhQ
MLVEGHETRDSLVKLGKTMRDTRAVRGAYSGQACIEGEGLIVGFRRGVKGCIRRRDGNRVSLDRVRSVIYANALIREDE